MLASLLTLSVFLTSVSGFVPSPSAPTVCGKTEKTIETVESLQVQPTTRNNNVRLNAVVETGVDPMFSTIVLGAVLLGTMVAHENGEYTVVSNSAKSLVADKELEETVGVAIAETNNAADFDIEELKKESTNIKAAKEVDPVKKADAVKKEDPVKEAVPEVIDIEAERMKLARIFGTSLPVEEKIVSLDPVEEVIISSEKPFLVKLVVKAIMPWRKFSSTAPTPLIAKTVVKTITPWRKFANI